MTNGGGSRLDIAAMLAVEFGMYERAMANVAVVESASVSSIVEDIGRSMHGSADRMIQLAQPAWSNPAFAPLAEAARGFQTMADEMLARIGTQTEDALSAAAWRLGQTPSSTVGAFAERWAADRSTAEMLSAQLGRFRAEPALFDEVLEEPEAQAVLEVIAGADSPEEVVERVTAELASAPSSQRKALAVPVATLVAVVLLSGWLVLSVTKPEIAEHFSDAPWEFIFVLSSAVLVSVRGESD